MILFSYLKNTCICSGILNWTFSLWLSFCFCFFGESPDVVKLRKTSIFHLKTDLEMLGLSNEGMCAWEWKKEREVAQSCPTLCGPMDCSPPDSSIHEIFQARVLEWVGISFSRASSWLRDRTQVSHHADRRIRVWATRDNAKADSRAQRQCFKSLKFSDSNVGSSQTFKYITPLWLRW